MFADRGSPYVCLGLVLFSSEMGKSFVLSLVSREVGQGKKTCGAERGPGLLSK